MENKSKKQNEITTTEISYKSKGFEKEYTTIGKMTDDTKELIDELNFIEVMREKKIFHYEQLYTKQQLDNMLDYKVLKYLEIDTPYTFKDITKLLNININATNSISRNNFLERLIKYVAYDVEKPKGNTFYYIIKFYKMMPKQTTQPIEYYKQNLKELYLKNIRYSGYYKKLSYEDETSFYWASRNRAVRLELELPKYNEKRFEYRPTDETGIVIIAKKGETTIEKIYENDICKKITKQCITVTYNTGLTRLIPIDSITEIF